MPGQRFLRRQRMILRGQQHHLVVINLLIGKVAHHRRPRADAEIGTARAHTLDHRVPDAIHHLHPDLRIAPPERHQDRRQLVRRDGGKGRNGDLPLLQFRQVPHVAHR